MSDRNRRWFSVILLTVLNTLAGVGSPTRPLRAEAPLRHEWGGIFPTVMTPFCGPDGGVDVVSLKKQIEYELHGKVHGLLVLGTFGEGQYVTNEEREQVIHTTVRMAYPNIPVVVGIHTCDSETAREQMLQAKRLGASAVLVKYLGNPHARPEEVYSFYAELAALQALPIFYYHLPSQTGLRLSPDDVAAILSLPGVVGIKESVLNLCEVKSHIERCKGMNKIFFTSTALNLVQFLDLGGCGAMCPEAVLQPGAVVQIYDAYAHDRYREARCTQKELFALMPVFRLKPTNPGLTRMVMMKTQDCNLPLPMSKDQPQAQVKCALNCVGVRTPTWVKCPLPVLTDADERCVKATMSKVRKIDWYEVALQAPPESPPAPVGRSGGMLLRTGAFQLGAGVSMDLLRSQGDGLWGFPID